MDKHGQLINYLDKHRDAVSKVVEFNPAADKFFHFNFTATNTALSGADVADT